MKKDSKNVNGNPRLQRPSLTPKTFAQPCSFIVNLGLCNLEFPYTFLESPDIIQYYKTEKQSRERKAFLMKSKTDSDDELPESKIGSWTQSIFAT